MSPDKPPRHVSLFGLSLACDICGQALDRDGPLVALVGNGSSSAFQTGFINPFTTADPSQRPWPDEPVELGPWELCSLDSLTCNRANGRSRPGCALHPDCLQVFMRHCTARDPLDILWQTCAWRRVPWIGAAVPEIRLLPRPGWQFQDALLLCAERCGLKGLDSLPQVVIGTILERVSRDDCFWRYVTAMHMAQSLSMVTERPLRIIPLSWLVSWERGSPPKVASEEAAEGLARFIRFTIDRDGMSKFERMSGRPQFNRERFDDKVFVVEREDVFGASLAMFKNGLLQLSFLDDFEENEWPVWDTLTPPDLARCLVKPERPLSMLRYHSIDLASVTGITFFIYDRGILGIHGHSRARPYAMESYRFHQKTIRNLGTYCAWVYVPLPPGDTLVSCGPLVKLGAKPSPRFSQHPCRFLIRMRLSGETIVGKYTVQDDTEGGGFEHLNFFVNRPEHPPTTLLYCTDFHWPKSNIPFITTYSDQGQAGAVEEPWQPYCPPPGEHSLLPMHSHASLENIRRVRMFYSPDQPEPAHYYCRGMLIDYDDGGQRALGECRLHVDSSDTFERPSRIAFLNVQDRYPSTVVVLFDQLPSADDPRLDDWLYYEMAGTLHFWFNTSRDRMAVRGGTEIPQMDLWEEVPPEELLLMKQKEVGEDS